MRIALQHVGHAAGARSGRPRRASRAPAGRARPATAPADAAPGPRRRSGRPSCAGSAMRTGPGTRPACAAHRAQRAALGVVDALAAHLDRAGRRSAAARAAPCRASSCPSPIRRRCRASRRAAAAASRRRTAWNAALAEPAARDREVDADVARRASRIGASAATGCTTRCGRLVDQLARVRVLRVREHLRGLADLDQPAALHHADAVGEAAHQVQVVRDEQQRHAHLAPAARRAARGSAPGSSRRARSSARRQISSLRLAGQRHRDHRALALAAGELVRVGVDAPLRVRDAGALRAARSRAPAPRSCAAPSCSSSTSPIWLPTVYSGFSAVIGSWKIIAIVGAADAAHLAFGLRRADPRRRSGSRRSSSPRRPAAAPTAR